MIVGIQGSQDFKDYSVFLSGMATVLRLLKNKEGDQKIKELLFFCAGPNTVKKMTMEYVNVSNFKSRGIKTKLVYMPESWFKSHLNEIDIFAYFCNKKENFSPLAKHLDDKGVWVEAFRYLDVQLTKKDNIYDRGF